MIRFHALSPFAAALACICAPALGDVTFRPLDGGGRAYAVSHDGLFIAGQSNGLAARWSATTGTPLNLGALPGTLSSIAYGISADGSVLVGQSGSSFENTRSFRWTESGMIDLNTFGAGTHSVARGVSADGQVVIGNTCNGSIGSPDTVAYRWTASTGAQSLARTGGTGPSWGAQGISADGTVIVGNQGIAYTMAFRWDGGHMAGLPFNYFSSHNSANAVSADGTVAVGIVSQQAARWSGTFDPQYLGFLPGAATSEALGISGDGSVVVGTSGGRAFLWNSGDGMQDLQQVLSSLGAAGLEGWMLSSATAISPSGRHIVGYGHNPFGQTQAWIATVPSPGAGAAIAFAACLMVVRRRR